MAARKPAPSLKERTPTAEWIAAGLGLALTLGVLGYCLWEGVSERSGSPELSVRSEPAERRGGAYVVPLVVENTSAATAAGVEVRGALTQGQEVIEERRLTLSYVPGGGQTRGGLLFRHDPARYRLVVEAEGYEEP